MSVGVYRPGPFFFFLRAQPQPTCEQNFAPARPTYEAVVSIRKTREQTLATGLQYSRPPLQLLSVQIVAASPKSSTALARSIQNHRTVSSPSTHPRPHPRSCCLSTLILPAPSTQILRACASSLVGGKNKLVCCPPPRLNTGDLDLVPFCTRHPISFGLMLIGWII